MTKSKRQSYNLRRFQVLQEDYDDCKTGPGHIQQMAGDSQHDKQRMCHQARLHNRILQDYEVILYTNDAHCIQINWLARTQLGCE